MEKPEKKKSSDFLKNALNKTGEASKKAAETIKAKSQELSEQTQAKLLEARIKKYNPLFAKDFFDTNFKLPKLIQIVDENIRKGIDVCEGAIGWVSEDKDDVRSLHLYSTAVESSKISFLPTMQCDSFYYADPHNANSYVNIDSYFSSMQQEKLAELQDIAYSLGAKQYWVELVEEKKELHTENRAVNASAKYKRINIAETDYSAYGTNKSFTSTQSIAGATFSETRAPTIPDLCWFANDKNMQNLINMRCKNNKSITEYAIELSNSGTMSASTAKKISATVLKCGASCNFSKNVEEEHNQKLVFKLQF